MPENPRTSRRTFLVGGTVAAAAVAGLRPGPVHATARPAAAGSPAADNGARVVAENYVGLRTLDLTIDSPALASTGMVRLLLPPRWSPGSQRTWPVLYLLHGAGDDYTSWTRSTDVAALTEGTDVLVVMPTAGRAGFYSDWWNHGPGGPPRWETFHLVELRQILERGYRAGPGTRDRAGPPGPVHPRRGTP
jgi:S-formylglutathione hydrolase FrmB